MACGAPRNRRLCRDQAHLSRRADQFGLLRPAAHQEAHGHVPGRRISTAGRRLRLGSGAAHHGGGVRRHGPRDPRPNVRRPRRHQRQFQHGRLRPGRGPQLHHVFLLGRRLRRLVGDRWPDQRLLDRRHLQDPAGRDPRAALSAGVRGVRLARRFLGRRPASRRLLASAIASACCAAWRRRPS